jgi:glutaredoxin-related protein
MENTQQEINETVKSNNVVLFMKGTKAAPPASFCRFINNTADLLNALEGS